MNQADLITTVAERAGLTKADAGKAVEALVGTITEALKQGDEVRIAGFGTFGISERGGPQSPDRRADHDRSVEGCQVHRRQVRQGSPQRWLSRGAAVSVGWPDAVGARARRLVRPPAARSVVQTRGKGLSQHGSGKIFSMPRVEPTP